MSQELVTAPLWYQTMVSIRSRITANIYQPGQAIPSESQLQDEFNVSRITVRKALEVLERQGLVVRRQGVGTFVRQQLRPRPNAFTGYLDDLYLLFAGTELREVEVREVDPPAIATKKLGIAPGERVTLIERSRYLDGEPFAYTATYLPAWLGRRFEPGELMQYRVLEVLQLKLRIRLREAVQRISAKLAGELLAEKLDLQATDPVLQMEFEFYKSPRNIVAMTEVVFRADRYEHQARLVGTVEA